MPEPSRQRLFFALWPPESVSTRIAQGVESELARMPGKHLQADQLHITLAFLGNVDEAMAQCARKAAQQVGVSPFSLALSTLGFFPRPRVVWLAPATVPAPLRELYQHLNRTLESQCQYEPERRPFRPHMTLIRKCRRPPPKAALDPIHWPVNDFALVASETLPEGARYRVVAQWPLMTPDKGVG